MLSIGLTEAHGLAVELALAPPPGVTYSFIEPRAGGSRLITSPIEGFLGRYDGAGHDLLEAVLSPILTRSPWVFSLAALPQATAFGFCGLPLPRSLRIAGIKHLLLQDNFKKLIFRSQAGRKTLHTYGRIDDNRVLERVEVVYPAVRCVPDELVRFQNSDMTLLFTGDFFRKGGVNVLDAFERAQTAYPGIKLILCCDEAVDFRTGDGKLRSESLQRIRSNPGILFMGRVPRERLLREILPAIDVYLIPTYVETFGFSILEAMSYGLPVISTNHFAIPEMIEHGVSGLLVDTSQFACEQLFKGYVVNDLPQAFREHVTEQLHQYICMLIGSLDLRRKLGLAALQIARTKFSIEARNARLLEIYRSAVR
jgi:glycosyltransferase involved in cell wall biosynthesis